MPSITFISFSESFFSVCLSLSWWKLKYCLLKYHFFLCEIKDRKWNRNIISALFIQRALPALLMHTFIIWMAQVRVPLTPGSDMFCPLSFTFTYWAAQKCKPVYTWSPLTSRFYNTLCLGFMWSRIKSSLWAPHEIWQPWIEYGFL